MGTTVWAVIKDGVIIDKVFYGASHSADYVKDGLIRHDGYDSGIEVVKEETIEIQSYDPYDTVNS